MRASESLPNRGEDTFIVTGIGTQGSALLSSVVKGRACVAATQLECTTHTQEEIGQTVHVYTENLSESMSFAVRQRTKKILEVCLFKLKRGWGCTSDRRIGPCSARIV